jgi:hypothetical protein
VTSHRDRKRQLERQGLSDPELQMLELLQEVLERFRWSQVLGYAASFLLREKLKITDEERDRVLKSAAAAVEQDGTLKQWQDRVAAIKAGLVQSRRDIKRALRSGEAGTGGLTG